MTIEVLIAKLDSIPITMTWLISEAELFRGKQQLYLAQAPQKLQILKEHALIESSVSSNRIEGVTVVESRIKSVVLGNSLLRDRDEEEVRGYQKALRWIHEEHAHIRLEMKTILKLHKLCRGEIWDSGKFKEKQVDITEKTADGREFIRFSPPGPEESQRQLARLIDLFEEQVREKKIPSLVLIAAFDLDFLSIHPFRDGNGRVSRLLFLLNLYHAGYEVGKYISLERIVEENKERYYQTLLESSQRWHEGKNDIWPYAGFVFLNVRNAYRQLDERLERIPDSRGAKTDMINEIIERQSGAFSIAELRFHLPGVSLELIRRQLKILKAEKKVKPTGRGRNARWVRCA